MTERNVKGSWTLKQSNGPLVNLNVNVEEGGGAFGGFATESDKNGPVVDARVFGDDITFTVRWTHGPIGVYSGRFGLDNRMSGFGFDQANPASQATWIVIDRFFPRP